MADILWSNDDVIFTDGDAVWKTHETDMQAISSSVSGVSGILDVGQNIINGCVNVVSGVSGSVEIEREIISSAVAVSDIFGHMCPKLCIGGSTSIISSILGSINSQQGCISSVVVVSNILGSLNSQQGCISSIAETSLATGITFIFENYLLDEQSVQDGQPVELYLFDKDDGAEFWSYTSTDYNISHDGRTFLAALIKRSDIVLDLNSLKTRLEVDVDLSNTFARNFISEPIEGTVKLTIYRRHADSYVTYWKGYLQGVKFLSKSIKILLGLKISSLKRFGLMRKFQRNCGLALYSTWCTISKTDSDYYVDGIINSIDGTTIDATIFSSKADEWFIGGIFKTDNGSALQKIVYHSSTEIRIARSVSALSVGDTFRAWAGCDHLKPTCKDKFGNKLNYGGQPYLPDKNPFIGDAVM